MLVASATLVIGIIGPKVPLHKTCSYSMLVFACYIGHWHYWDMCSWNLHLRSHVALGAGAVLPLRLAHGVCVWGGACPLCLERCSFGTGRAKWLILVLYVLLEHWSWALLSPMCLCAWAIELVCWLCLVLWLLVLSGPTCLCAWPVELACWLRALHWSLALLGPKYLFTRPVHTACWFLLATLVIGIIGTCARGTFI